MLLHPEDHTLHCLVDMPACVASGYCLQQQHPATMEWHCVHNFTAEQTVRMAAMLDGRRSVLPRDGLYFRFTNVTWAANGTALFPVTAAAIVHTRPEEYLHNANATDPMADGDGKTAGFSGVLIIVMLIGVVVVAVALGIAFVVNKRRDARKIKAKAAVVNAKYAAKQQHRAASKERQHPPVDDDDGVADADGDFPAVSSPREGDSGNDEDRAGVGLHHHV